MGQFAVLATVLFVVMAILFCLAAWVAIATGLIPSGVSTIPRTNPVMAGLKVHAQGAGYNAVYWPVWCGCHTPARRRFTQQDGTYLTPGIGYPLCYETDAELLIAVQATCEAKIKVMGEQQ